MKVEFECGNIDVKWCSVQVETRGLSSLLQSSLGAVACKRVATLDMGSSGIHIDYRMQYSNLTMTCFIRLGVENEREKD